jgi:tetratricopeptide (TPR) repeat protein
MRIVILALLALVPSAGIAHAADNDTAAARQLYAHGMAHFQLAEYDEAIEKWQQGFRLKPVPEFLYNIGQAYRLSERPEKAIQAYKSYLRMAPKAAKRAEVQHHIEALQSLIARNNSVAAAPPSEPQDPKPPIESVPATPPPLLTVTPAATSSEPLTRADVVAKAAPRRTSIARKGWFWGVVAGGTAIVAGAIVLGVVLGTRDQTRVLGDLKY